MFKNKFVKESQEEVNMKTTIIGPSVRISGDISGEEDLLIQGKVEGTINLGDYRLAISEEGKIKATICAGVIDIGGQTEGEITGSKQVIVRKGGKVEGAITAPRVVLEDGCTFKGKVDADESTFKLLSSSGKVKEIKLHSSLTSE